VDVGLDEAGADAVDTHAVERDLVGQADGQGVDPSLRRGVVDVLPGGRRAASVAA
jgi:hypothetical protein